MIITLVKAFNLSRFIWLSWSSRKEGKTLQYRTTFRHKTGNYTVWHLVDVSYLLVPIWAWETWKSSGKKDKHHISYCHTRPWRIRWSGHNLQSSHLNRCHYWLRYYSRLPSLSRQDASSFSSSWVWLALLQASYASFLPGSPPPLMLLPCRRPKLGGGIPGVLREVCQCCTSRHSSTLPRRKQ